MAIILNIESSTTMCSVAIGQEGECTDFLEVNEGYAHAERLAPFVDELLRRNQLAVSALDAIAVSKGPGSYTGLRIGVSLAKGLCFSRQIPLIAVETLKVMCLHSEVRRQLNFYKDLLLCPMLDARRMEVYTAVYDMGLVPLMDIQAKVLDENSYSDYLEKEAVLFFGNGVEKFKGVTKSKSAYFAENVWPSAQQMTTLSQTYFDQQQFEDVAYFEPYYLKDFMGSVGKG